MLGLVGAIYPLTSLLAIVTGDGPAALWFVAIASLFLGIPVWCVATGTWALVTGVRVRESDPVAVGRTTPRLGSRPGR